MDDVAEIILSHLCIDDRPSQFELRAMSHDFAHPRYRLGVKYCDVLKITAPVEAGRLVFKVDYFDNHNYTYDAPRAYRSGWKTLRFEKDDFEGAVAFSDGFMSDGGRSEALSLHEVGSSQSIARWEVGRIGGDANAARVAIFRGAFKALLAK